MASSPKHYPNPEIPSNEDEFFILYWNDRKALNAKLEEIARSQTEDREDVVKFIDKIDKWIENHDDSLQTNLSTLIRHDEKIDSLEKKVNTWSLTNSLAAIGAFLTALFMKGS